MLGRLCNLLIIAIGLLGCSVARAQTFNASTCSEANVTTAIASAVAYGSGATVVIPAGTCTWSTNLTSPASGTLPANFTIQGAGNTGCPSSCNDSTIIQMNSADWYFEIGAATNGFRLTGITFESTGSITNGVLQVQGPSSGTVPQVRLDHLHSQMTSSADTLAGMNYVTGVIDHSLFDETVSSEGNSLRFYYAPADSGDYSWSIATGLGTSNFIYIENNIFNHGVANDGQEGARFVFRHNTFNDTSVQTHPTGGDGRGRGARAWEIYDNTFTAASGCLTECGNAAFLSSGTGVIWGNTGNSIYSSFITLHSMRVDSATYTQTATPNGWGYCGTNFNGTGSVWDQNSNTNSGYRCMDQPGSGAGDLLSGNFPSVIDVSTGTPAWPNQALEPVYEWNDSWNGTSGNFWGVSGQSSTCSPSCTGGSVLASNRDYYLWCDPSSPSGCTSSFNGTIGTGNGVLSSRPSTCTTGVAYFATDQGSQGTLYKCTSTNTWTSYYVPYTYPHPLDTSSGPSGTGTGITGNISITGNVVLQ